MKRVSKTSILKNVKEALYRIKGYDGNITEDMDLNADLQLDSLDLVDLAMTLEEIYNFNIEITDEELEEFKTITDVIDVINNKLNID